MSKNRRGIRLPESPAEAIDTLERFVVRARRIEAHSLVKSKKVKEFIQQEYKLVFNGQSVSIWLNSRPDDEEVFESLAARVRPCIVDGEPIQLEKVVAAIRVLTSGVELSERQNKLLNSVGKWYENHLASHSYEPIAAHEEIEKLDTGEVSFASDALLGLGWFYADLVHADPKQEKEAALKFPYDARYNQGVFLVSYIALTACSLLALIREVNGLHDLGLSSEVWESQVVAGGGPLEIGAGDVYVGPPGSVPPPGIPMEQLPEFKKLDLVAAMRLQYPNSAVDVQFIDASGNVSDSFEGFYSIDKDRNSVVININDEVLLEGRPEDDVFPVEQLTLEQAFYIKTIKPVDDKVDQFIDFLGKAKVVGKINIALTWRGVPVRGEITFPDTSSPVDDCPSEDMD